LIWHDLQNLVMDWMVFLIPSQYIAFKTGVPRVLKILVVPHRCLPLQWRGYY
jgi:hypothetical protein